MLAVLESPFDLGQSLAPIAPTLKVDSNPEEVLAPATFVVFGQAEVEIMLLENVYFFGVVQNTGEEDDGHQVRRGLLRPSREKLR